MTIFFNEQHIFGTYRHLLLSEEALSDARIAGVRLIPALAIDINQLKGVLQQFWHKKRKRQVSRAVAHFGIVLIVAAGCEALHAGRMTIMYRC